jgi:AraC family transcriptional regulator
LAKIAVAVEEALARRALHSSPGQVEARLVAQGDGWTVEDVVCTCAPRDRTFEERHSHARIAIVGAGTFQYRSGNGRELMIPGSVLLGNQGQSFECAHEHGTGDRCLSFGYTPEYFERLSADAGFLGRGPRFTALSLPPLRVLSPLFVRAWSGLHGSVGVSWEELGIQLAARTVQLAAFSNPVLKPVPSGAVARVTRVVRWIERRPEANLTLANLAQNAGLSLYHFLRTFQILTGATPHRYVLRTRLCAAAARLVAEPANILDIALDCGFGVLSNFNRAFRTEFGVSPRAYRAVRRLLKS